MLQKARTPQPNSMFREISESVVVSMQQIMPLPIQSQQPTKPIETAVSFMLTITEFNTMGRPTVGDYLLIGTTTEKTPEEIESTEIPISEVSEEETAATVTYGPTQCPANCDTDQCTKPLEQRKKDEPCRTRLAQNTSNPTPEEIEGKIREPLSMRDFWGPSGKSS
jgi:hypothetical protein